MQERDCPQCRGSTHPAGLWGHLHSPWSHQCTQDELEATVGQGWPFRAQLGSMYGWVGVGGSGRPSMIPAPLSDWQGPWQMRPPEAGMTWVPWVGHVGLYHLDGTRCHSGTKKDAARGQEVILPCRTAPACASPVGTWVPSHGCVEMLHHSPRGSGLRGLGC